MIRLDRVTKLYPSSARPALDDVSLNVDKGEFVFLIGPSGSGKSTFLRLLLKEENPTRGRVQVAGKDLGRLSSWKVPALRRTIGCVFQDFRLLEKKSVAENVGFALEVIGKPAHTIRKVVPEVLEMVGLDGKANRLPGELSGGEQQRVAIARAFVNRPLVLLADEPTGNLDPDTSQDIMLLLERINRTGTTVLMATHDNNIVDSMRRRVIELDRGGWSATRPAASTGSAADMRAELRLLRGRGRPASQPHHDDRDDHDHRDLARLLRRRAAGRQPDRRHEAALLRQAPGLDLPAATTPRRQQRDAITDPAERLAGGRPATSTWTRPRPTRGSRSCSRATRSWSQATPDDLPATFLVEMKNPERYTVLAQQFPNGKNGVDQVQDQGEFLDRLFCLLNGVRNATIALALCKPWPRCC